MTSTTSLFADAFVLWSVAVSWLEVIAFGLSLAMVVCNIRVLQTGWPLAIASSSLYAAVFWHSRLYGDAALQFVFIVMAAWGWWCWQGGRTPDDQPLPVRRLSRSGRRWAFAVQLAAWPTTALFLKRYTDTDVAWWDAFPTAASLIGQVLLAYKFIENWAIWLIVNVVSVCLFAYKGLWLTALLYALFAAMSVAGWRAWAPKLANRV